MREMGIAADTRDAFFSHALDCVKTKEIILAEDSSARRRKRLQSRRELLQAYQICETFLNAHPTLNM
jgi:hypothetical protein